MNIWKETPAASRLTPLTAFFKKKSSFWFPTRLDRTVEFKDIQDIRIKALLANYRSRTWQLGLIV